MNKKLMLQDFRSTEIERDYQNALKSDAEAFFITDSEAPMRCPMCYDGSLIEVHEIYDFKIMKCECGFMGSFPRPTQEELEDFYTNGKSNRLWHEILNETREKRKSNYSNNIIPLLDKYVAARPLCLVDVGCGEGIWLDALHSLYPDLNLFGIDPVAGISDNYTSIKSSLKNYNPHQKFDVCTAMSVIEHVTEPTEMLRECKKILKPKGILFITAPNVDGFDFAALSVENREWEVPQHINFFNLDTIKRCIVDAGFNVIEAGTFGYLDVEIVRKKLLAGASIDNEFLKRVMLGEKYDKARQDIQKMISDNNLSGQMYVIAKGDGHEV